MGPVGQTCVKSEQRRLGHAMPMLGKRDEQPLSREDKRGAHVREEARASEQLKVGVQGALGEWRETQQLLRRCRRKREIPGVWVVKSTEGCRVCPSLQLQAMALRGNDLK